MSRTEEQAPAKINLALHVTGQRGDGYHLLDSLVTFTERGDRLTAEPAETDDFTLSGPFAAALAGEADNLVTRARDLLRAAVIEAGGQAAPVALHLEKNLPVSSGIGGGSADAAAALRALSRLWDASLPESQLSALALSLGADVPMCLAGKPALARGIGEELEPVASLPAFHLLLLNPLKPVSTPDVFRRLEKRDNAPLPPLPASSGLAEWADFLAEQRNDLEEPARRIVPEIGHMLTLLKLTGAPLARMSGSGATCFGLYESAEAARKAGETISAAQPGWYAQAVSTRPGSLS